MVPHYGALKFRCGTHEIKIMDVSTNREDKAGSIARAIYTASGYLDTVHQDIESTRVLEIEGSTTTVDNTPTYSNSGSDDNNTGAGFTSYDDGNTWHSNSGGGVSYDNWEDETHAVDNDSQDPRGTGGNWGW